MIQGQLPKLTIAVSTIGDRYKNLIIFPPTIGIYWLLLVQRTKGNPVATFSTRPDVSVVKLNCIGLSNSRNQALLRSKTPLVLFADDDSRLCETGIVALRSKFMRDNKLDFAAGWRKEHFPETAHRRKTHTLTKYNTGRICAPELMLHLKQFRAQNIYFDPNFGLGSSNGIGEEFVFVTDAIANGLTGKSFPIITASHPQPSTGNNWHSLRLLAARHAVIERVFGRNSRLIKIAYAVRHHKKFITKKDTLQFAFGTF